jgi:ribosomal protein S18 acetylase RimI-like enzyme
VKLAIRDAVPSDASAACRVMQRSIVELCTADHQNDPAILRKWLANKTPEHFLGWILQPRNSLLVATEDNIIVAVGSVTDAGHITLNYVSPEARFRGISRALLSALEARAARRGSTCCTLNSTETARRFYSANGYREVGPPENQFGPKKTGYRMSKVLRHA